MNSHLRSSLVVSSLLLAGLAGTARAAPVTFNLAASPSTISLPGWPAPVTVWRYVDLTPVVPAPFPNPGPIPGPVLVVNQGDSVTINLTNNLAEPTSLEIIAQGMVPDLVGVAPGGSKAYTFTANAPGTFLYQAGPLPDAQRQVPMGLYGALVVRPTGAPSQAYAGAATAFGAEAVLVLSEIDPQLHAAPTSFDLRNYAPRYYLINGAPYPGTAPIGALAGQRVMLRYLNAGLQHHSMALLGLNQTVVAVDGSERAFGQAVVAETLAPGMTLDAITTIPAGAAAESRFALYDASLKLQNNTGVGTQAGFGGMLTFLTIPAGTGGGAAPPAASNVAVAPSPTAGGVPVTVTASVAAAAADTVAAAEFFIDAAGTPGGGIAMTGGFGAGTLTVSGTISTAQFTTLASGSHTIFVHGLGTAGGWGAFAFGALILDKAGPAITGPTFTPNPTNGSVGVAVHATANDTAAGGSNVVAATYAIGAGPAVPMTVNVQAPIASLDAVIPATTVKALADGSYTVTIRAQDALLNWGTTTLLSALRVDQTGPVTGVVAATPSLANGTALVRVTTTLTDATGVASAEGFLDPAGSPALGSGVPLVPFPVGGAFGGPSEQASFDIPAATVASLSAGTHTVSVRGKDLAGNWGALASGTFSRAGAVADTLTFTANTSATQQANVSDPGLLLNDIPVGGAGRTAVLATLPVRTGGTGTATIKVTCGNATASGVCSNGSYRVTLTAPASAINGAARQASKVGTYRFTYRTVQGGVSSPPATVTITVI